jgi:hypothetical protein
MTSSNPFGEGSDLLTLRAQALACPTLGAHGSVSPSPSGRAPPCPTPWGTGSASTDPPRGDSTSPDPGMRIQPRTGAQAPVGAGAHAISNHYGCDDTSLGPCS